MSNKLRSQQAMTLGALSLAAQSSFAGSVLGSPLGVDLGGQLGQSLPIGIGGIAGITALSLVVGIQLVKRNKKK